MKDMTTQAAFKALNKNNPESKEKRFDVIASYRQHGKRKITDRFVKYPYPKQMGTTYTKEIKKVQTPRKRDEAFNLEKEHKIINPHKMELRTTAKVDYQPFQVVGKVKQEGRPQTAKQPF